MRNVVESLLNVMVGGGNNHEGFQGHHPMDLRNLSGKNAFTMMLALILVQILVLFFGRYLWNNAVVPLVGFAQPCDSIWRILGLSILIKLLM